jgi:hypothetical protein
VHRGVWFCGLFFCFKPVKSYVIILKPADAILCTKFGNIRIIPFSNSQDHKSVKIVLKTLYYANKLNFARCLIPLLHWRASLFTFRGKSRGQVLASWNDGRFGLHRISDPILFFWGSFDPIQNVLSQHCWPLIWDVNDADCKNRPYQHILVDPMD